MKLAELLQLDLKLPPDCDTINIKNIQTDSRKIEPGDLFIAVAGLTTDGRKYISQAIANGAVAVLVPGCHSREGGNLVLDPRLRGDDIISRGYGNTDDYIPIIEVENLSQQLGIIASRFYSDPSQNMNIIGVTGTNGKSSTIHYIAEILRYLACPCGTIGTLGVGTTDGYIPTQHTTPDPIELQKSLAGLYAKGMQNVSMEVSSHALVQNRVNGIKFNTAVFTNLTQDHLDYHKNMANYWAAKLKLFLDFKLCNAIVNLDDPYGRQLLSLLPKEVNLVGYTLEEQRKTACNTIIATNIQYTGEGISTTLTSKFGTKMLDIPVIGAFNLSNMLAAIAACVALGHTFEDVLSVIHKIRSIPGRMQCIQEDSQPLVVVDYAHTPDALMRALATLKCYCHGKLWCVFGCGGDRDRTKRTDMLAAALNFSDYVILTQDNPRTEDPTQIIEDTLKNHKDLNNVIVEPDRLAAIQIAISKATMQDAVLIAGKGHENYQIIGTAYIPFSDVAVVKDYMQKN